MKTLISIIVNCYNGEKYLKDTIQSVLNQKYQNWEMIFWDNQSNDNNTEEEKLILDAKWKSLNRAIVKR